MMSRINSLLALGSALALQAEDRPTAAQVEFFEKKVRPVLATHCYECHSAKSNKVKGGLLLDSKAATREGGDTGPAVVPRDLKGSLLIEAVRWENEDLQMPPKKKLSASSIADLENWIQMGAPDPRSVEGTTAIKREIDIEAGKNFWAFQPVKDSVPSVRDKAWPRTSMDRHVLAGLEAKNLKPVADANPRVLVRRVYFDLIGLPPAPQDVEAFLKEVARDKQAALEALVDKLLASPQFGERWGRHWLDVARYAESNGMERNAAFPHAWRYRDYVIDSFNADKPFDVFIREQIAGNLLPGEAADARHIATGFLAMGPKSLNNRNAQEFKMDLVDEQLDVTTRAFMAVTVACARCHDHKFDPIPTEDYYSLAGIFSSTQTMFGGASGGGIRHQTKLIELSDGRQAKHVESKANLAAKIAALQKRQQELVAERRQLQKELKAKAKTDSRFKANLKNIREISNQLKSLRKRTAGNNRQTGPLAMGVVEGRPADIKVHIRGNVATLGQLVPRGFPRVMDFGGSRVNPAQSGRLQLAEWIAHRDNPLTGRVFANRVWHHLFGRGVVRTVDNFGETGERPGNLALLDHLASRFVALDWSVKKLIREIVLSRAYQLSSSHSAANAKADPDNTLFWKMNQRRLDAESMRDAMLAASGLLKTSPYQGSIVSEVGAVNLGRSISQLQKLRSAEFAHRSVYLPVARQAVPEVLKTFDFAEPSIIVGRREITTVPTQALFLLNSKFVTQQAAAMADRVLKEGKSSKGRISLAFQLALSRPANATEQDRTTAFLAECNTEEGNAELRAWTTLCQALLASAEFRYIN